MTQPVDQIDQLLLQTSQLQSKVDAVASNSLLADVQPADNTRDNTKSKQVEKLIQVVAGGKRKRYLGKVMTTKEIEQLNDEEIQKLCARYEAVLGGLITNKLTTHMCYAYSRALSFICPTLNFKVEDIVKLTTTLSEGPFIDLALCSLTCKLYHEYGHLLAPIEAASITSSYLTPAEPPPSPLKELKPEDKPIN